MLDWLSSMARAGLDALGLTIPPAPAADPTATVAAYLLANSVALGPLPRTGGVLHKIDSPTALAVASAIVATAAKYQLKVSLLTSVVAQESKGDPRAHNENKQNAKPGDDAIAIYRRTDYGVVQIDGSTLDGLTELKGLTIEQKVARAEDPVWAIDFLGKTLLGNTTNLRVAAQNDPTLLLKVPRGDARIAAANTWNAGLHGTMLQLQTETPNLAYGEQVVKRADALALSMDVASS